MAPGNYTISAKVFLAKDPTPADNGMTHGQVQILPAPTLTVTPSSGPPGTTALVHGARFSVLPAGYPQGIGFVEVTFDNQLIGFTNSLNGSFNFTFSIPLSQGARMIKALDEFSGAHASASFFVSTQPSTANFALTIKTGPLYFPGETAVIYVDVALNGVPITPSTVRLQLILVRPDGSNLTLVAIPVATGLFKASFTVPTSKSLGTYVVVATANVNGPLDATSIESFEVQNSWLSQNRTTIATATALTGLAGVVAVAWQKGYLRRRKDESPLPF